MYSANPLTILKVPLLFVQGKIDADKNETLFARLKRSMASNSTPVSHVKIFCNYNDKSPPLGWVVLAGPWLRNDFVLMHIIR